MIRTDRAMVARRSDAEMSAADRLRDSREMVGMILAADPHSPGMADLLAAATDDQLAEAHRLIGVEYRRRMYEEQKAEMTKQQRGGSKPKPRGGR